VSIADYAASFSVFLFCALPYILAYDYTPAGADNLDEEGQSDAALDTLDVPSSFGPTAKGRSWFVNPADCPVWAIFFAIVPGFLLTVLFFFDHNVSSLLCQAPEFGLKKGSAYHWDFFIIGVQILITGLLGIPPVNGLIPQAPLHTDALCEKKWVTDTKTGVKSEVIVKCHEQRASPLIQALLIGCFLPGIKAIGYLPKCVLDGLFLFMGIASFAGNTFYERVLLFITDKERRYMRKLPFADTVPMPVIRNYTLLQLLILACIFTITRFDYIDGFFPFLIAVLVPLRIYGLPRLFGAENVDALDSAGEAPAPYEDSGGEATAAGPADNEGASALEYKAPVDADNGAPTGKSAA